MIDQMYRSRRVLRGSGSGMAQSDRGSERGEVGSTGFWGVTEKSGLISSEWPRSASHKQG